MESHLNAYPDKFYRL